MVNRTPIASADMLEDLHLEGLRFSNVDGVTSRLRKITLFNFGELRKGSGRIIARMKDDLPGLDVPHRIQSFKDRLALYSTLSCGKGFMSLHSSSSSVSIQYVEGHPK